MPKVNKDHANTMPGITQLNTDQGMGHYNWGKKVAGHDGKKQHSPVPSMGAFKDRPIAVGFTPEERKMARAAAGGKTTTMTGPKSKEPDATNKKSPVRKFTEAEGDPAPQDPNAQQPAAPAPAPVPATPALDPAGLIDALEEITTHAKERRTLDPQFNKQALADAIKQRLGAGADDTVVAKLADYVASQLKINESFRGQVRGMDKASKISPVLGKKSKKHPFNGRLVGEDDDLSKNEDTVTMDVPLLIRVMEYAKEDAKTDMELHRAVERMLSIGGALTMNDYDSIVSNLDENAIAEATTDYQKRRQREKDVDAGKPVKREPKNPQNDFFARRKKEKQMMESFENVRNEFRKVKEEFGGASQEDIASAISRRIMHSGLDLIQQYGLDKVMAAIDDVASFHEGVEELGTSDISGMVHQVKRNLEEHQPRESQQVLRRSIPVRSASVLERKNSEVTESFKQFKAGKK